MKFINNVLHRYWILSELFTFLWKERIWWMIPMITILILLGILFIFAQSSPVAPFIYTLF